MEEQEIPIVKTPDKEDPNSTSNSTNNSYSESILQDISWFKSKNIFLITKSLVQKIPEILSYLQNDSMLALNKIQVLKYLESLFSLIDSNSEIFIRKFTNDKDKLNLIQILFSQYISYTNNGNQKNDENEYRKELLSLIDILLSQVFVDRDMYHYILSFLIRFINEKNTTFSNYIDNKGTPTNEIEQIEESNNISNFNSEHLSRVLTLLQKFYQFIGAGKTSTNYFFFRGDWDSFIRIPNIKNPKENKPILNLEDSICVLMFIKVFPSEYIKSVVNKDKFELLNFKFTDNKDISIGIDMDNNLITNFTTTPLIKLIENDTNCLVVKIKRKKGKIKPKIYLGGKKVITSSKSKEKESKDKKEEIKEIILFQNFVGICYNVMIYKTKKKEILPKFLESELKRSKTTSFNQELGLNNLPKGSGENIMRPNNSLNIDQKMKIQLNNQSLYYNGINNEDLLFPFIKNELSELLDKETLNEIYYDNINKNNNNFISNIDIKDFYEKIIAIYIPNRYSIPTEITPFQTLLNANKIILHDSINFLEAEFITKSPSLNGIHIYKRIMNNFSSIGGLNNLLPIIELMTKYQELLTKDNLENFFHILICVLAPQYQKALDKEKNTNFFLNLSYFLEKIPEEFYDSSITGIFRTISSFLTTLINENNDFYDMIQQFFNYILMNERIIFKFKFEEQKEIFQILTQLIESIDPNKRTIKINILKIIKIILHYDEQKDSFFCCKNHAEYFILLSNILEPELDIRLEPIERLISQVFIEFEEKMKNESIPIKDSKDSEDCGLYKLFRILTFDISPCVQKFIINIFAKFIENHPGNYLYALDKYEELLDITLFVYKNSIFDVKADALNLILILIQKQKENATNIGELGASINNNISSNKNDKSEKNDSGKDLSKQNEGNKKELINEDKGNFITNNILPFYLLKDKELLETELENDNEINNEEMQRCSGIFRHGQNFHGGENKKINLYEDINNNNNNIETENNNHQNLNTNNDYNGSNDNNDNNEKNINNNDNNSNQDTQINNQGEQNNINNNNVEADINEKEKNSNDNEIKTNTNNINSNNNEIHEVEDNLKEEESKEKKKDNDMMIDDEYFNEERDKEKFDENENGDRETDLFNEIYADKEQVRKTLQKKPIKKSMTINDIDYNLQTMDPFKKKIYSLYDKNKLKPIINSLFEITYNSFHEGFSVKLNLNLLIKIVSKGDLLLIADFINKISMETKMDINRDISRKKIIDEIFDNQNLLHWLIETCFQATLIKESNLNSENFKPGFNIDCCQNDDNETPLTLEEKKEKIQFIIKISKELLTKIFNISIFKMDYLFTWSKYYYELRNDTNNFQSVRALVLEFMYDIGYNISKQITEPDIMNDEKQKMSAYFFNLLFEFVTFYKLKLEDMDNYKNKNSIYQELSSNLKLILITKMENLRNTLSPMNVQEGIDNKFEEYPFFRILYLFLTPLWKGEKKESRQENDIYSKYISGKKNVDINELELLFYSFSDIKEFVDKSTQKFYGNKGIPLIYILYHFFTLIFSIGGTEAEIKELFGDFRLFILLLIISSSTLSTPGIGKKKRWPSDEQYKNVQQTVEAVLFNFLFFLFNKIKDTKSKLDTYKENENDENNSKYFHYLHQIYLLLIDNLGYFLKILNKIYKEIKNEEMKSKGVGYGYVVDFFKGIKNMFVEYEGVKSSGGYILIQKMYAECPNLSQNKDNYLDKITSINFKDKGSTIDKNLEECAYSFINDTEIEAFFNKHNEDYKKKLFPFVPFIETRRDLIKNIIPIYDNRSNISSYPDELCLIPDYFPETEFDLGLNDKIKIFYKNLKEDLQLDQKKWQIEEHYKSQNYKKEKKKLFSFTGIWSTKEYFYDKAKYKLKYRLLNHLSEDCTRVLLTPVIDIYYYLPQFSKFDEARLFRNLPKKTIYKSADLSYDIVKRKIIQEERKKINDKSGNKAVTTPTPTPTPAPVEEPKETKGKIDENIHIDLANDIENIDTIDLNENANDNKKNMKNILYELGQENYTYIYDNPPQDDQETIQQHLFLDYIQKKHSVQQDNYCIETKACFVKIGYHIPGIIYNNKEEIGFYSFEMEKKTSGGDIEDEDYDSDRKVCFGSVFGPQNHRYNFYYLKIPYNKIQLVLKRTYFFKKCCLEIFTEEKKSYFFKIDENKFKYFLENIRYHMEPNIEDISIEYVKYDEKIGFMNKNNIFLNLSQHPHLLNDKDKKNYNLNLKNIYEKWTKWEISTLKLLMLMNIYANRSYNDINQYPVFPWIITDYSSEKLPPMDTKNFIRQFNKPMGMMDFTEESKERKENYEDHWKCNEADEDKEENYDRYGSHYSTSLYLTYYLVRVLPFSYVRIELQGKNFDDPNRLFNSLPNSFDCAITQKSDLRELIPEFFCFPEMFYNMNDLNLGEITDHSTKKTKLVGNVAMPNWANFNGYSFVEKYRQLLECSEISEKINEWFNIIFGSKQKGDKAKKIGNLFIKQTYEDFDEIHNKASKADKIYQNRMVEFGVTPHQLFKYDTVKRQSINDSSKLKKKLLFGVIKKLNKNEEILNKELEIEEIKNHIEENIYQIFVFSKKKNDKKKERIYFLSKDKVFIYSKEESRQIFKESGSTNFFKQKTKSEHYESNINNINNAPEKEIRDSPNYNNNVLTDESFDDNAKENNNVEEMSGKFEQVKEQKKIYINQKYDKKIPCPKYRMNNFEAPTVFFGNGFFCVCGGFWNGDIFINRLEENKTETKKTKKRKINIITTGELSPIIKILIDKNETYAICYNNEGTVFIYNIDTIEKDIWTLKTIINEGQGEISTLAINENLNIFISCYKNGYSMLYTLPVCKLINSFIIETETLRINTNVPNINESTGETNAELNNNNIYVTPDLVFISQNPLPCFVFYIRARKSLVVFSINFHFIKETYLGYEIVPNGIKKYTDFFFNDYLFIFNSVKNVIDIHKLSGLDLIVSSPTINHIFVDFVFSRELDHIILLVKARIKKDEKPYYKILVLKNSGSEIDWK